MTFALTLPLLTRNEVRDVFVDLIHVLPPEQACRHTLGLRVPSEYRQRCLRRSRSQTRSLQSQRIRHHPGHRHQRIWPAAATAEHWFRRFWWDTEHEYIRTAAATTTAGGVSGAEHRSIREWLRADFWIWWCEWNRIVRQWIRTKYAWNRRLRWWVRTEYDRDRWIRRVWTAEHFWRGHCWRVFCQSASSTAAATRWFFRRRFWAAAATSTRIRIYPATTPFWWRLAPTSSTTVAASTVAVCYPQHDSSLTGCQSAAVDNLYHKMVGSPSKLPTNPGSSRKIYSDPKWLVRRLKNAVSSTRRIRVVNSD